MVMKKKVAPGKKTASTKSVPAKKVARKKVSTEGLTGLALHRARVANGEVIPKKKGAAGAKRRGPTVYKAPDDFKPFFLRIDFRTNKDGLTSNMQATRYKGRFDTEGTPSLDMAEFDPATTIKLALLFGAGTFANAVARRLPASSIFSAVIRVASRPATGGLAVRFAEIKMKAPSKKVKGKFISKVLEKNDPIYRGIRKANKTLPSAFMGVTPFPSLRELKAMQSQAEGDE